MSTPKLVPFDVVCSWVENGISEVFSTMFTSEICAIDAPEVVDISPNLVVGAIAIAGEANGTMLVYVGDSFARRLTSRVLELPIEAIEDESMVNDVIGELANMVVGAVKSRLTDQGVSCAITIPSIVRGAGALSIEPVGAVERRSLGFKSGEDQILVELMMSIPK
jgi:CheY-specific phosphatase CheX